MIKLKKLKGVSKSVVDGAEVLELMEETVYFTNGYVTYGLKKNYEQNTKNYVLQCEIDFKIFKVYPVILYVSEKKPRFRNIRVLSLLCLPFSLFFFLTLPLALLIGIYLQGYHDKSKNRKSWYNNFYRITNFLLAIGLGILVNYIMVRMLLK